MALLLLHQKTNKQTNKKNNQTLTLNRIDTRADLIQDVVIDWDMCFLKTNLILEKSFQDCEGDIPKKEHTAELQS